MQAPGRARGLGLSMVYGVVTQTGGRISVDGTPGQGTTFTIELPRSDAPAAALAKLRQHSEPIDLLLTDVVMPVMSGPALASHCVAERPDLKVLFMSGYAEHTLLDWFGITASQTVLSKPFSAETLAAAVRGVMTARVESAA